MCLGARKVLIQHHALLPSMTDAGNGGGGGEGGSYKYHTIFPHLQVFLYRIIEENFLEIGTLRWNLLANLNQIQQLFTR